jgi:uncharacterized membrane protein YdbT with pleckstrin-like domain
MLFQENECCVKTYHHHPFAFFVRAIDYMVVSLPFFFVASFFSGVLSATQMMVVYLVIAAVFAFLLIYSLFFFYFDRLVITNRRIVHIDWEGAFRRFEHEAELNDIQDVGTVETGILSAIPFFDFGTFTLETASKNTTIVFRDAPDPEAIKHFIYHLTMKPTRIGFGHLNQIHDSARQTYDEEAALSRRE